MFANRQIPSPQLAKALNDAIADSSVCGKTGHVAINLPKPQWRGPDGGLSAMLDRWNAEDAAAQIKQ